MLAFALLRSPGGSGFFLGFVRATVALGSNATVSLSVTDAESCEPKSVDVESELVGLEGGLRAASELEATVALENGSGTGVDADGTTVFASEADDGGNAFGLFTEAGLALSDLA